MIYVIGRGEKAPEGVDYINVTSRSDDWGRVFSPFTLGPVKLYGNYVSQNVENAWQYAKVYSEYMTESGDPTPEYFEWAQEGWSQPFAVRYPMGKGNSPVYSYWDGLKLDYVSARKRIYIPVYRAAVLRYARDEYEALKKYSEEGDIALFDFDGYREDLLGWTLKDVVNNLALSMGHAFVLKMMIENGD